MIQTAAAVLFLCLVLAVPVALAVWSVRTGPYSPSQAFLFFLAKLLTRILWRARIPDRMPLDARHGALLVSNHRSSVDPFFIQMAAGRKVHWMVAGEYLRQPLIGWFLRTSEVIPVNRRGIDTAATKSAIRRVMEGGVVGVFPEGRINTTKDFMLPVRPGVILMALRGGVPILPCYVEGSPYRGTPWSPLLMTARVRVRFGQPIDLTEFQDRLGQDGVLEELTVRCARAIAALAGHSDFQPRIAGRRWKADENPVPGG